MPSIPHYEDLSAKEIYESLDLVWWVSEKLDGSYLEAGLDDQGRFYTRRKGGERMYQIQDWPNECWASTYRNAHEVAGMLVEALVTEGAIKAGQSFGSEILWGNRPNTIPYDIPGDLSGMLVITTVSWPIDTDFYSVVERFMASLAPVIFSSPDGKDIKPYTNHQRWKVQINNQYSRDLVAARLMPSAKNIRSVMDMWLPQESKIEGFTIMEVLDASLSRKHPNCGDRNWNDLRKELKQERDELKVVFNDLVLLFKEIAYKVLVEEMSSVVGAGSHKEGVVVKTPSLLFKIVDRPSFSARNHFTHRIKYMLVGGRRPVRPCFLSRTKDWSKEDKLKRLDVLLERYCENRYFLRQTVIYRGNESVDSYTHGLHQRMLNMFADTRKRIEDGR